MTTQIDFTQEVAAPRAALDRLNEIVNRHAALVDKDDFTHAGIEDEFELLVTLMGLGRLIEFNVRAAWQCYAVLENIRPDSPKNYNDVLKLIKKHFTGEQFHFLLRRAQVITDGLVHSNFYQAFCEVQKAYKRNDLGLTQPGFNYQTIVFTTLTARGLTINAKTGQATTTTGEPVPHRAFIPARKETIENNFESFYVSATFVFVYDVLLTAFQRSFYFRKCISNAVKVAKQ